MNANHILWCRSSLTSPLCKKQKPKGFILISFQTRVVVLNFLSETKGATFSKLYTGMLILCHGEYNICHSITDAV